MLRSDRQGINGEDLAEQARCHRIVVLAAIYTNQGNTGFYRRMLDSSGGTYSEILNESTGIEVKVSHEDVLMYLGCNPPPSAPNFDQEAALTDEDDEIGIDF